MFAALLKAIQELFMGTGPKHNRARFYRCSSQKCGYAWVVVGDEWCGPFLPAFPDDERKIRFTFGEFYPGVASSHSKECVLEFWSDCRLEEVSE